MDGQAQLWDRTGGLPNLIGDSTALDWSTAETDAPRTAASTPTASLQWPSLLHPSSARSRRADLERMAAETRHTDIDLTDRSGASDIGSTIGEEPIEVGQLYWVGKALVAPVLRFCWRIRTEGLENVPQDGPAIIAPNHAAAIDSFFVPCVLPRRITYVGKAEYMDDWKTRKLFPALGMIPIDRSGGDASQRAAVLSAR